MTLQQLEYLIAVDRVRHFGKAAEQCQVTQPTLSLMVQKLENELGVVIFDRRTQPVGVTVEGRMVIEQAWKVLQEANQLCEMVQEMRHSLSGAFTVGILPTIGPYLLPRFFPQLMKEHSDMDVRVTEMKTHEITKALTHGDIDAAIVADLGDMDGFDMHTLFYEQFYVYAGEDEEVSKRETVRVVDLKSESLWLLDEGHCFRDQLVKYCELKSASNSKRAYGLGSIETFMRMVEKGTGVTFIPELAVYQLTEEQKRLVRPFAIPIPTRKVVMLTRKGFIRLGLRDELIARIKQSVPQGMLGLSHTQRAIY